MRTLANPSLLATSGEKATFLSGGEFAYQVVVGAGGSATTSIEFKEFGVRLEFTPYVQEDGTIRLKVAPEVSEPDYSRSILGVPPLNTRKASTLVTLRSGEYLVIGGLKDTRSNKVERRLPVPRQHPACSACCSPTAQRDRRPRTCCSSFRRRSSARCRPRRRCRPTAGPREGAGQEP